MLKDTTTELLKVVVMNIIGKKSEYFIYSKLRLKLGESDDNSADDDDLLWRAEGQRLDSLTKLSVQLCDC